MDWETWGQIWLRNLEEVEQPTVMEQQIRDSLRNALLHVPKVLVDVDRVEAPTQLEQLVLIHQDVVTLLSTLLRATLTYSRHRKSCAAKFDTERRCTCGLGPLRDEFETWSKLRSSR